MYIGKTPTVGNFQVCDAISVVNGQAAYTLQVGGVNVAPESANHMLVSLNGILQKPGSSFTISSSTMTFASNLATGDVIDFVQILGNVLDIGQPSDDTVTAAKLNNDIISGQTALTSAPDDTDELLISDGGTLKRIDVSLVGGTNTPNFFAYRSSNQTNFDDTSFVKVAYNAELFDTGNGFDTSTGTYTIPSAGKYFFGFQVRKNNIQVDRFLLDVRVNGTGVKDFEHGTHSLYGAVTGSFIRSYSANDTIEAYIYQQSGATRTMRGDSNTKDTWMYGFKIIE